MGFRELRLPESLRSSLSRPLGPVLSSELATEALRNVPLLATCGDVVTAGALSWGLTPFLSVVDGKTTRDVPLLTPNLERVAKGRSHLRVKSAAGGLSVELQQAIHDLVLGGGGLLEVDGEEDLAVLPLMVEMRVGSIIIYGQPGEGVCMVSVDDRTKAVAANILTQMEVR